MRYVLLIFMLPVLCSCSSQSSNGVDATYQRQIDDFDRQTAETDRQLKPNLNGSKMSFTLKKTGI